LHHQLLTWRKEIAHRGLLPVSKRWSMKAASIVLRNGWLYRLAGKLARTIVPRLPRLLVYNRFNAWGRKRELPQFPQQSFRELYRQRRRGNHRHGK
jgi:L-lactate dehydrogenase complex protein LldF